MKLEAISIQRYQPNGFFRLHHDYFGCGNGTPDRVSTFNVFLQGDCDGGGTHFPLLPRPNNETWCQYIDCDSKEDGVVFKPIVGNAIYWENVDSNGTGFRETLHQALPVLSGVKVSMNVWQWRFPE